MLKEAGRKYKISFCTVCMDRLSFLKKTLPQNIKDASSYDECEFVVLDYNSKDGLEDWITDHMGHYIEKGILIYIKTRDPEFFWMSHSKNVVTKNASGDIVCNVDADNFIGQGFAEFINGVFIKRRDCFLTVQPGFAKKDCYGRICVFKTDFMRVTGYDENMMDYGFEDIDFLNRLKLIGKEAEYISNEKFLRAVIHGDSARMENGFYVHEIKKAFIRYINHYSSELLFLFKNGTYSQGHIMINRLVYSESMYNVFKKNRKKENPTNESWSSGIWVEESSVLVLKSRIGFVTFKQLGDGTIQDVDKSEIKFFECKGELLTETIMILSQLNNRTKMIQNKKNKTIRVNEIFGEIRLNKV